MELSGNKVWLDSLNLDLALWQGEYRGALRQWLRWYDTSSNWIPTESERTQQAERRAQKLAQRLRELGVEP